MLSMSVTTLIKFEVTLLTRLSSGCYRCVTVCASRAAVSVIYQAVLVRRFIFKILTLTVPSGVQGRSFGGNLEDKVPHKLKNFY